MELTDLLLERRDGVGHITLNRPDVLNALRTQTYRELREAIAELRDDRSVGVVVVRGAGGRAFSSGGDVREQRTRDADAARRHLRVLLGLARDMRDCGKPIIAAVEGYCVGGGNELALWCDITIATEGSVFGQLDVGVGSVPVWGATQLLPLLLGEKKARELIYRCRRYSAAEALAMGMINEVVPDGELDAGIEAWTSDMLQRSPQSLRLAKLSINHVVDAAWPAMTSGAEYLASIMGNEEQREGQTAFLEKRAPDWQRFR